ncbi:MAG: TonB family protein [Psychrobacter sp.]|nr:TonB family protein [Psychrobacter sp.]
MTEATQAVTRLSTKDWLISITAHGALLLLVVLGSHYLAESDSSLAVKADSNRQVLDMPIEWVQVDSEPAEAMLPPDPPIETQPLPVSEMTMPTKPPKPVSPKLAEPKPQAPKTEASKPAAPTKAPVTATVKPTLNKGDDSPSAAKPSEVKSSAPARAVTQPNVEVSTPVVNAKSDTETDRLGVRMKVQAVDQSNAKDSNDNHTEVIKPASTVSQTASQDDSAATTKANSPETATETPSAAPLEVTQQKSPNPIENKQPPSSANDTAAWQTLFMSKINPRGNYPHQARKDKVEGIVTIKLKVSASGEVTSCEVVKSSGHAVLDSAAQQLAIKAASQAQRKRQPGKAQTFQFPVTYSLDW